jgi:hypothetical protein
VSSHNDCTEATFFISKADAQAKMLYSKELLDLLKITSLANVIFVHEDGFEASSHPRVNKNWWRGGVLK